MENINQIDQEKTKMNMSEKKQIIFLILIAIAIATLIVAIIVIVKNIEEIKSDPFEYGITKTEIESCICYNPKGFYVNYPGGEIATITYDLNNR